MRSLPQRIRQSISAGVRRLVLTISSSVLMMHTWRHNRAHEFCMLETLTVLPTGRLQSNLMRDDNLLMSHTTRQEKCENDAQNVLQSDAPSLDSLKAVFGRLGTVWGRLGTVWGRSLASLSTVLGRSWRGLGRSCKLKGGIVGQTFRKSAEIIRESSRIGGKNCLSTKT